VTAFDRFLQAAAAGRAADHPAQPEPRPRGIGGADFLGAAPAGWGDMLARQPQIMDGLIDPRFFRCDAGPAGIIRPASPRRWADADFYEEFLDRLRLFGQESLFLIGTRILSGTVSAQQAGVAFRRPSPRVLSIPCVAWVHGSVLRSSNGPDQGTAGDRDPRDGQARQPRG